MRISFILTIALSAAGLAWGQVQEPAPRSEAMPTLGPASARQQSPEPPPTSRPKLSPAERQIEAARQAISKDAKQYQPHNALAMALSRRARETADTTYYEMADEALRESFRLAPDNHDGRKIEAWVLLGRHEFAKALEIAEALRKSIPDDLLVYALLTDAHIELGNYGEAEEAAQFMLDLRPGTVPGLTRGAYLRELLGDAEGAIDWMGKALQRVSRNEVEDQAWILTQLAHLLLSTGRVDPAEQCLEKALDLFPRYHYALAEMANVRTAQGKHAEAAELLRRHVQTAPHPENYYYLAEALQRAGAAEEAEAAYTDFEREARAEMDGNDNANRELIFYYAGHGNKPAEALRLARREIERRRDVRTRYAYAWALHVNGDDAEALRQLNAALEVGIRDAEMLYRAGVIASKLDDGVATSKYLNDSLEANPRSVVADAAREMLKTMAAKPAPTSAAGVRR